MTRIHEATDGLSLGIPGAGRVSPGTHLCALYSGRAERDGLLIPFLDEGLRHGDQVLCLVEDLDPSWVQDDAPGRPGPTPRASAQLEVRRASDAFEREGELSIDLVVEVLLASVDAAATADGSVLRVVSDMSVAFPVPRRRADLVSYESALNRVIAQAPAIFMCLHDLTELGADVLVDVLRSHPKVLLDRALVDNPYFLDPTEHRDVAVGADDGRGAGDGWGTLTAAELRGASRVSRGTTNRVIAADLQLSHHTVDAHLKHIYLKLHIHSRVELTVLALRHRLTVDAAVSSAHER